VSEKTPPTTQSPGGTQAARPAAPPAAKPAPTDDVGQAEVQAKVDEANEQGFVGTEVDPTPDENYSLKGVTSGAPTPETDAAAKAEAERHKAEL
jgi:hypothetical protein